VAFALEHPMRQAEAAIVVPLPAMAVIKDRYRLMPVDHVLEIEMDMARRCRVRRSGSDQRDQVRKRA
jgi:hypothetical protein